MIEEKIVEKNTVIKAATDMTIGDNSTVTIDNAKIISERTKAGMHIFNFRENGVSPAFSLSKPVPLADKKLLKEAGKILDEKYSEDDALEDESIFNYRNHILQQLAQMEGHPLSQTEKQELNTLIIHLKGEDSMLENKESISQFHQ